MQAQQLDSAIDSIRLRFGSQALTRAADLAAPQPWPSQTAIDHLTGIGGLPRGRLSLFTGSGTCGKLTLALNLLAKATHEFAHAVVIDQGGFDLWNLLPFSPELSALTVVSAQALETAGEAASVLAKAGAGFILLLGPVPEHWLGPLESGANRSGTVIVGVIDTPDRALAHASSFSLGFARTEWVWERGQLVGISTVVRCLKNRVAPPLGETALEIRYQLTPQELTDYQATVNEIPITREASPRASVAAS